MGSGCLGHSLLRLSPSSSQPTVKLTAQPPHLVHLCSTSCRWPTESTDRPYSRGDVQGLELSCGFGRCAIHGSDYARQHVDVIGGVNQRAERSGVGMTGFDSIPVRLSYIGHGLLVRVEQCGWKNNGCRERPHQCGSCIGCLFEHPSHGVALDVIRHVLLVVLETLYEHAESGG